MSESTDLTKEPLPHSFGDYLAACDRKRVKPHFVLVTIEPVMSDENSR